MIKKFYSSRKIYFCSNSASGHVKCSFDQLSEHFFAKFRNFLLKVRKWLKQCNNFKQFFSPKRSARDVKCSFDKLFESFRQKSESFWSKSVNGKKNYRFFSQKTPKDHPWTRWMQFWRPLKDSFVKPAKIFSPKVW